MATPFRNLAPLGLVVAFCSASAVAQEIPDGDIQIGLRAVFDWSVPDRFGDLDGDGLVNYPVGCCDEDLIDEGINPAINPSTWHVDFDACDSISRAGIREYLWTIEGLGAPISVIGCRAFSYEFPHEGTYQVSLTIRDVLNQTATITQEVTVQDWLIIGLGESFASGEGNPDIPTGGGTFDDMVAAMDRINLARADYSRALEDLWDVEIEWGPTLAATTAYFSAWDAWFIADAACFESCLDFFGCWCCDCDQVGPATDALIAATEDLGGEAIDALTDAFYDEVQEASDAADAAFDAVMGAVSFAEAGYQAALDGFPIDIPPVWQHERCHRSALSGQALAALALEQGDPRTSVTFVHLACSGSTIPAGLLGPPAGVQNPANATPMEPQIQEAHDLLNTDSNNDPIEPREIDAILIAIGGNDIGFADIIKGCVVYDDCFSASWSFNQDAYDTLAAVLCDTWALGDDAQAGACENWLQDLAIENAALEVDDKLDELRTGTGQGNEYQGYPALAAELETLFPEAVARERIFIN